MPRLIKKYLCDFKCGRRAEDYHAMVLHEHGCWKNPKNKSCMTCRFEERKGSPNWDSFIRKCKNENVSKTLFADRRDTNTKMHFGYRYKTERTPETHCKYWEERK